MIDGIYQLENGSETAKVVSELMREEGWLEKKLAITKIEGR